MLDLQRNDTFDHAFGAYKQAWFDTLCRIAGRPLDVGDWIGWFIEGLSPEEAWELGPSDR